MKWYVGAGVLAFVGFALWQSLREGTSAVRRANQSRQPWDTV